MNVYKLVVIVTGTLLGTASLTTVRAALPNYDHIVVVFEENHSLSEIRGNTAHAPYLNSLGSAGMWFLNSHSQWGPSQPNYLHVFSGSSQGADGSNDDFTPGTTTFHTPNLGAELIAAGQTFVGYSEDLPNVGSIVDTASAAYAKKHSPWVNWQTRNVAGESNAIPATTNQPFFPTAAAGGFPAGAGFPTTDAGYAALPKVAMVTPNQLNDMHSGSTDTGDAWFQAHIGGYATWAATHNSLLIMTFDESGTIPTFFYGQHVLVGTNSTFYTHDNLLRTLEDLSGLSTHAGNAANVANMTTGVFTDVPEPSSLALAALGLLGLAAHWLRSRARSFPAENDRQLHPFQCDAPFP